MNLPSHPRTPIEDLIREGDIEGLLHKAGELHGHFCPFVALGVRAGYTALRTLEIEQNLGLEEIIAIVETNNCFSDGIQAVTGCTFANNALIYRDLGKTAVTVSKRDGDAVRIVVRADYADSFDVRFPEASALFQKIIVRHDDATPEERDELARRWAQTSYRQLEIPDSEIFAVHRLHVDLPAYAPIRSSVRCAICGENVMETRARFVNGEPACITCASAEHPRLDGAGIRMDRMVS